MTRFDNPATSWAPQNTGYKGVMRVKPTYAAAGCHYEAYGFKKGRRIVIGKYDSRHIAGYAASVWRTKSDPLFHDKREEAAIQARARAALEAGEP